MNEEKRFGGAGQGASGGGKEASDDKSRTQAASRARNRTVMLTPEMTGQVRALLYQDQGEATPAADDARRDPINELLPPVDWSRPDRQNPPAFGGDTAREPNMATDDFGRDLTPHADLERGERSGSTGKISQAPIQEALAHQSAAPEAVRRQAPAAGGPGFSVNAASSGSGRQNAAPAASPGIGARRFGADPRQQKPAPTSRIVGFLISFDKEKNGEVHEIRAGRWLVTSRPTDQGEYLLIEDPSVSPLHAIVRATKDGKIEVLDQLSEFGTSVIKGGTGEEIDAAGVRVAVGHGDIVRFGERAFIICTVPKLASMDEDEAEG